MSIFREKRLAAGAYSGVDGLVQTSQEDLSVCSDRVPQLHSSRKSPDEERGILEDRQIDVPEVAWIKVPDS